MLEQSEIERRIDIPANNPISVDLFLILHIFAFLLFVMYLLNVVWSYYIIFEQLFNNLALLSNFIPKELRLLECLE